MARHLCCIIRTGGGIRLFLVPHVTRLESQKQTTSFVLYV